MKALKIFAVWLLLTVLPLQGMAFNFLMTCKASQQGIGQAMMADTDADHGHLKHGKMHHGGHFSPDAEDAAESVAEDAQPADGSCVNYCAVAFSIPVSDITFSVMTNPSNRISYIGFHVPFVVPDGPEHRPRFLIA